MTRASGSGNVFVNGIGISRQGDNNVDAPAPRQPVSERTPLPSPRGSGTVFVNGQGCGRVGDSISGCTSVAAGSPNVIAG